MDRLTGKVATITGGAGGLGFEIARLFAAEGAAAIALADIDPDALDRAAQALTTPTTQVVGRVVDVRDPAQVDALVSGTARDFGRVDVVVNNAAILAPATRMHNVTPEDFRNVLDVNLVGVWNGITAAYRAMRETGGSVINTASIAGVTAWTHSSAYGAAKAGVIHLTKQAAIEYARERIRVNAVCPGTMNTKLNDTLPPGALEQIVAGYPLGRLGDPADVAALYVHLASDESTWTTGSAFVVDGGYSAR